MFICLSWSIYHELAVLTIRQRGTRGHFKDLPIKKYLSARTKLSLPCPCLLFICIYFYLFIVYSSCTFVHSLLIIVPFSNSYFLWLFVNINFSFVNTVLCYILVFCMWTSLYWFMTFHISILFFVFNKSVY